MAKKQNSKFKWKYYGTSLQLDDEQLDAVTVTGVEQLETGTPQEVTIDNFHLVSSDQDSSTGYTTEVWECLVDTRGDYNTETGSLAADRPTSDGTCVSAMFNENYRFTAHINWTANNTEFDLDSTESDDIAVVNLAITNVLPGISNKHYVKFYPSIDIDSVSIPFTIEDIAEGYTYDWAIYFWPTREDQEFQYGYLSGLPLHLEV